MLYRDVNCMVNVIIDPFHFYLFFWGEPENSLEELGRSTEYQSVCL